MALFVWSDKYSVNITQIDEQHKKLINMLNELHDSMKVGKAKEVTGKILSGLVDYIEIHFSTEEKLMQQYGYTEYTSHKAEHDRLTQKVLSLRKEFEQGAPILTVELLNFLKEWLQTHILGTDKKYSAFLNSKGVV